MTLCDYCELTMVHVDGCNIFLVPGYDANGIVLYDTGTYSSIAKRASKVQNYCSHFPAPGEDQTPSMEGGQGWVGERVPTCVQDSTS